MAKTPYRYMRERAIKLDEYVILLRVVMGYMVSECHCADCDTCKKETAALKRLLEFERKHPTLKICL